MCLKQLILFKLINFIVLCSDSSNFIVQNQRLFIIQHMNKCQHNLPIDQFCISEHCQWKQPGGCHLCIKKYHNHYLAKLLQQQELITLIKKLTVTEYSIKPNCRNIQESIYAYFNNLKNSYTNSLDLLCKTLINSIGAPFLIQNKLFNVYKRARAREYKRINQKQFKKFLDATKKINFDEMIKQEAKLYKQHLKKYQKILSEVENCVSAYEILFKQVNQTFTHEKNSFQSLNTLLKKTLQTYDASISVNQFNKKEAQNNEIQRNQRVQKIQKTVKPQLSPKFQPRSSSIDPNNIYKSYNSSSIGMKEKQKQKLDNNSLVSTTINRNGSTIQSLNSRMGQKDFDKIQKLESKELLTNKRPISLQRNLSKNLSVELPSNNTFKKNQLILLQDYTKAGLEQKQKIHLQDKDRKNQDFFYQNDKDKKQTSKQNQINMRKEQLISMMKATTNALKGYEREKSKKQEKEIKNNSVMLKSSTKQQTSTDANLKKNNSLLVQENSRSKLQNKLKLLPLNLPKLLMKSITQIQNDNQNLSNGSLQDGRKLLTKNCMNAHPKLQFDQIQQKPKQIGCSRLVIVPTSQNFPMDKQTECSSPLLKKKNSIFKNNSSDQKPLKQDKNSSKVEAYESLSPQKNKKNQKNELKQGEQKSLNLLIKSISQKPQQAISTLEIALRQAPNNLSAAQYLSFLYLQNNKPKQALNTCNLILDRFEITNKQNEQLLVNLQNNKSAALNMLGRYSEAIVLLQKCLKNREMDTILKNLGDAYYFNSNYEKAIFYYEKAIRLSPFYDEASYNMAVCLYLQNNYTDAKQSIARALQVAPKNSDYLDLKKHIDEKITEL